MRLFGLLGKSLKHSFSKGYFAKKFAESGLGCFYENYELARIEELPELLQKNPSIEGLNVTIPYKEEVIPFLHWQNEIVREIKACNCIKIVDGKLYGFNTDVVGFTQSIQPFLQAHHTKALILGTGGAAKAVQYSLTSLSINYLNVSRSKTVDTVAYSELNEQLIKEHTLIINTSPVGMYPKIDEAPQIPYQYLSSQHLLYDLVYNPEKTVFLQKGEEVGSSICNGAEMLWLQAEESWRIWNS